MLATSLMLATLLFAAPVGSREQHDRRVSGDIYFTNNTPSNVETFSIEILRRDKKKVVARTRPNQHHRFEFTSLKPGKYLLRVTWPHRCVLWYRLDLWPKTPVEVDVIMDADCAHNNGKIQDLRKP